MERTVTRANAPSLGSAMAMSKMPGNNIGCQAPRNESEISMRRTSEGYMLCANRLCEKTSGIYHKNSEGAFPGDLWVFLRSCVSLAQTGAKPVDARCGRYQVW